jgi:hypothetical protein
VREGSEAIAAFEAETGERDPTLRELHAELSVAVSDRAETSTRRNIFRRIHEILGRIPQ